MYIYFSLQALSQAKDDEISALCEEMKKRAEKEKSLMSELLEVKALKEELSKERNSLKVNWFETCLKILFSFLFFSLSLRCIKDLRSTGILFKAGLRIWHMLEVYEIFKIFWFTLKILSFFF